MKRLKDIIEIIKCLEESGLSIEGISKATKNEAREQKDWFLSKLLGTLGPILLRNLLKDKGMKANIPLPGVIKAGEKNNKSRLGLLMPAKYIASFVIQKYYQNEPKRLKRHLFKNNLHNIKDGAYVINLDEYKSIGSH